MKTLVAPSRSYFSTAAMLLGVSKGNVKRIKRSEELQYKLKQCGLTFMPILYILITNPHPDLVRKITNFMITMGRWDWRVPGCYHFSKRETKEFAQLIVIRAIQYKRDPWKLYRKLLERKRNCYEDRSGRDVVDSFFEDIFTWMPSDYEKIRIYCN